MSNPVETYTIHATIKMKPIKKDVIHESVESVIRHKLWEAGDAFRHIYLVEDPEVVITKE